MVQINQVRREKALQRESSEWLHADGPLRRVQGSQWLASNCRAWNPLRILAWDWPSPKGEPRQIVL